MKTKRLVQVICAVNIHADTVVVPQKPSMVFHTVIHTFVKIYHATIKSHRILLFTVISMNVPHQTAITKSSGVPITAVVHIGRIKQKQMNFSSAFCFTAFRNLYQN